MFRRAVSAVAALALLLQAGAAFTQGHLSPHEPMSSSASAEAMPCHGDMQGSAEKVSAMSCCQGDCNCVHACGASALPTPAAELENFISAHFEALRSQSAEVPAHTLPPQRPPAAPKS